MTEIVDGNNLLGKIGSSSQDVLVSELAQVARARRVKILVVFDGPPPPGRPKVQPLGDVTIVWAAPRSADDEIVRRIREARDPRSQTVVTDDGTLSAAARAAGARTLPVAAYRLAGTRGILKREAEKAEEKPAVQGGVRDWERWFSDPKNRIR